MGQEFIYQLQERTKKALGEALKAVGVQEEQPLKLLPPAEASI